MLNGEGKTLAAIFTLFLNALANRRIHVCTANSFLAIRDCYWMKPILEFHGIKVSNIEESYAGSDERKIAYQANIVYGTGNEFGFDYLRDNMAESAENTVQHDLDFVLVDEIDSVLIDEARTPLIISGPAQKQKIILEQYEFLKSCVEELVNNQNNILNDVFLKAKIEFQDKQYDNACRNLYIVKRGRGPLNNEFRFYLNTTQNVLSELNKFEKRLKVSDFQDNIDNHLFFIVDNNSIELTEKGKNFIKTYLNDLSFWEIPDIDSKIKEIERLELYILDEIARKQKILKDYEFKVEQQNIISQLIKAFVLFTKDIEYIVRDNTVLIVDKITGRALQGKRYGDGLHQAIEAKENVKIHELTDTYATISLQSFFQKYRKLAGMSATALTAEKEFKTIYNKRVIHIPPFKKIIRNDKEDLVYKTKREKFNAIIQETQKLVEEGRPVLIGTTNVYDSELISRILQSKKIKHQVLNAKQDQNEALIISLAGLPRTVTVAALMAGRGTDIKPTKESLFAEGLAVIGIERHESQRLDLQLKGRSGRQGNEGSSQFFVSLEDNLMRLFGSDRIASLMDSFGLEEGEVIQHSMITKSI